MLSILKREMEKYSEIFNEDLENTRQNQSELMNTITGMKKKELIAD